MRGQQRVLPLHPNYHLEPSFASNGRIWQPEPHGTVGGSWIASRANRCPSTGISSLELEVDGSDNSATAGLVVSGSQVLVGDRLACYGMWALSLGPRNVDMDGYGLLSAEISADPISTIRGHKNTRKFHLVSCQTALAIQSHPVANRSSTSTACRSRES